MDAIRLSRLTLRPFCRTDGKALHQLLAQEPVAREWGRAESREECIHLCLLWEKDSSFRACCLGPEEGPLIGLLRLRPLPERGKGVQELSYAFHPAHWGQGYALESCQGLLQYAFAQGKMRQAAAFCTLENQRSIALLERLGMTRNPIPRQGLFLRDGQWQVGWEYTLSRRLFERRRNR